MFMTDGSDEDGVEPVVVPVAGHDIKDIEEVHPTVPPSSPAGDFVASISGTSTPRTLPAIPSPVVAALNHSSEQFFNTASHTASSEHAWSGINANAHLVGAAGSLDTSIPAAADVDTEMASPEDRRGIPCHDCGAIVKIYFKPQWYAITKGLDVGVRHTWYLLSPTCFPCG